MENSAIRRNRNRLVLFLLVCAILVTSALWLRARSEFPSSCLDCVPIPLQLAGMLNGPVAWLAYPFYPLAKGDVSAVHLAILLAAIAIQWGYVGYIIDRRHTGPHQRTIGRQTVGLLGLLLALGPLAVALRMYHVGLLYKVVALGWSSLMGYHFSGFLRKARVADSARLFPS